MKPVIISGVIVSLSLIGAISYGVKQNQHSHTRTLSNNTGTETTATAAATLPLTTAGQGGTLGVSTDSNSSASLQSNLGQQSSSDNSAPIPGPESFGQYDQYIDGEHALFADLRVGTGTEATANKTVAVVYKGWLTNGTLFDESKTDPASGKLQAFQFQLGGGAVIRGWEEGIIGMKVGGLRRLIVPPKVGYGAAGHAPIPPNAMMVFDVQLFQVD